MSNPWDVIVVGARCAGATLASLLSRGGARVLVLEASRRGTDLPLSTHFVQPPGMDVLDRIGVGPRVRAVTPASKRFRVALDDATVTANLPDGRAGYCVRRSTIDPWLQEAAEQSGAELRDLHRVVDLVRDEAGRVTGVVAQTPHGKETLSAGLVVGADGPHSTVARVTGVPDYLVAEGPRGGYWGYFQAPERWENEWDGIIEHRGDELRYVFRADGDLVVLVATAPLAEAEKWGGDHVAHFVSSLARSPVTGPLAAGKEPLGKVRGALKMRYFYRKPIGPGFALVGDAGHFKDFVTGQGMADAFLDAERLAVAVLDGRDVAYEHYWRERDVATLPLHFDALRQGRLGHNSPFMRCMFRRMGKDPELLEKVGLSIDRKIGPDEVLPTGHMLRFLAGGLLRGQFDVIPGFLKMGRELGEEKKELAARKVELERARAKLAAAGAPVPRFEPRHGARRPEEHGLERAMG